jgi:hypothetical protein
MITFHPNKARRKIMGLLLAYQPAHGLWLPAHGSSVEIT